MTARSDLNLGGKRTKQPVQIRPLNKGKKQYRMNRNSVKEIKDHTCDLISCFAADKRNYSDVLEAASRFKSRKYHKYNFITDTGFFPLPFGRTNILSTEIFRFCALIGNHLPPHMRAPDQLIATFSRSIYSGVAQTVNVAVRRLQLSAAQRLPFAAFPFAALHHPYNIEPRSRLSVRIPRRPPFADVPLIESLAAALTASSPEVAVRRRAGLFRDAVAGG